MEGSENRQVAGFEVLEQAECGVWRGNGYGQKKFAAPRIER
jgi:hypothetical protein